MIKKYTEEQERFYLKWGPLISGLKESPAYQQLEDLEDNVLNDLKTEMSSLSISDPQYVQKITYMHGMVEGVRRKRAYFNDLVSKYKEVRRKKDGR